MTAQDDFADLLIDQLIDCFTDSFQARHRLDQYIPELISKEHTQLLYAYACQAPTQTAQRVNYVNVYNK